MMDQVVFVRRRAFFWDKLQVSSGTAREITICLPEHCFSRIL